VKARAIPRAVSRTVEGVKNAPAEGARGTAGKSVAFARRPASIYAVGALAPHTLSERLTISVMLIGEGLVIESKADGSLDLDNVAHIDLTIGPKDGPVGVSFANALANQSAGHTNLLAVVSPNIVCKPATVMVTKVTLKGSKQVMQMFGPAQAAVARAVVDSVIDGTIPKAKAEEWVIVCGVFIAPSANDNAKIYKNNYEATKLAIKNAVKGTPTIDEIIAKKETKHPFE
jgi:5,6,7,8-tetrahydromethanopterin hydro-lyase